jgi:hypothetical protein
MRYLPAPSWKVMIAAMVAERQIFGRRSIGASFPLTLHAACVMVIERACCSTRQVFKNPCDEANGIARRWLKITLVLREIWAKIRDTTGWVLRLSLRGGRGRGEFLRQ